MSDLKGILAKLSEGKDLTKDEAMYTQDMILTGQATEAQIACILTALKMKGETLDEITGFAAVLRDKANTISPVHILSIFLLLLPLWLPRQDFRLQNMATDPFLQRVVQGMCLRHWE